MEKKVGLSLTPPQCYSKTSKHRHIGDGPFVPCRKVVLLSEVFLFKTYLKFKKITIELVFSGSQWFSPVTHGSQWFLLPVVLSDSQWLYHWLPVILNGSHLLPVATSGYQCFPVILNGYQCMVLSGYHRLPVVLYVSHAVFFSGPLGGGNSPPPPPPPLYETLHVKRYMYEGMT